MVRVCSLVDVSDELATVAAQPNVSRIQTPSAPPPPPPPVVAPVELKAATDALALEVGLREVPDALLGHGGHGPRAARGGRLLAP